MAPVRIVHLGLGNFFRAHGAWYTDRAHDAAEWGIAAFTGRTSATAVSLTIQDCLYTLLIRSSGEPHPEVVSSLSAVHAADDLDSWRAYFRRPEVVIVTLTVTEAGYRRTAEGGLDNDDEDVCCDIRDLRANPATAATTTVPGRLVAGLAARRAAGAGVLAIVSGDNIPHNGAMVARVVGDLALSVDPDLASWITEHVSFVTCVVDRITPRTTHEDRADVLRLLGVDDPQTVPTEPFSEWVLAGAFPGGRPAWETAGARFVADVAPFEQRKLWLLNGSHSLMAYAGSALGHATVADVMADPTVRAWVEQWWDAASGHLTLPFDEVMSYRSALVERFANPNMRHLLTQIAADGSQKIAIRAVPVIKAGLLKGRPDPGALRPLSSWIAHLRGLGAPVTDARHAEVIALATGSVEDAAVRVLRWLGLEQDGLHKLVEQQVRELHELAVSAK